MVTKLVNAFIFNPTYRVSADDKTPFKFLVK